MHIRRRRGKDRVPDFEMWRPFAKFPAIVLGAALGAAGAVALGIAGAYQFLEPEIPGAAELRDLRMQLPLTVYSRDGKLIAQIGEQRRIPVESGAIPQVVVNAFLAAEDDRFFEHPGVDWQGLVRALVSNVSAGGVHEGGGTITMQLARNTLLTRERTLRRKLKEVFLALRIEHEFDKQAILAQYLNRIFLGQRAYGVGAAAEVYFGKDLKDLTLPEAALIAGLPRSPSRDNPAASLERAHARRSYVLRRMYETGKIDAASREEADRAPLSARIHGPAVELKAPYVAEMVRQDLVGRIGEAALIDGYRVTTTIDSRLQEAASQALRRATMEYDRRHGYRGPAGRMDATALGSEDAVAAAFRKHPDRGSLRAAIVVSVGEREATVRLRDGSHVELDWDALSWARPPLEDGAVGPSPRSAGEVLAAGDLVYLEPEEDGRYRLAQLPAVGSAFTSLDPRDGAILALVGGFDYFTSKYNRAVQAHRQPGSAFKPFLYSAALEHGYTPATLVNDAPIVMPGGGDTGAEEWRPQNNSKRFYGPTPMREALIHSRNLVSIRLLRGTGIGPVMRHVSSFGFGPEAMPPNLTMALGTGQVTPLEMARGFAVFANGGWLVTPYFIERIDDAGGSTVFEASPLLACPRCTDDTGTPSGAQGVAATAVTATPGDATPAGPDDVPPDRRAPRAISAANAYVMTDMLSDVIQRGTGQRARVLNRRDLSGKTGTTSDWRDAWFVGFNADIVAAAWVGFDQERTLGVHEEGAHAALPMWIYFMEKALAGRPEHRLPQPPGVVRMWVSRETGAPVSAGASGAIFEAFLEPYVPRPGATAYDGQDDGSVPPPGDDSIF
jgi:penicillin-binding protein 1A